VQKKIIILRRIQANKSAETDPSRPRPRLQNSGLKIKTTVSRTTSLVVAIVCIYKSHVINHLLNSNIVNQVKLW